MRSITFFASALCFALSASAALAQSAPTISAAGASADAVRAYWTPARLASAKPIELKSSVSFSATPSLGSATGGPQVSGAGSPPTSNGPAVNQFLYNATISGDAPSAVGGAAPFAFFTQSRVFPDTTTLSYPWRASGKLFFHDPRTGGNFICSASTQRPRLIVTAGHCVFHASATVSQRYFYSNWLFVPAFRQIPPAAQVAPFCSWTTSYRIVTGEWAGGTGGVPNAQDVAIMESVDRTCNAGATLQRLGSVTGYYGYATNSLIPQSITQIGYPGNLDSGLRMQVTNAESFDNGGNNTVRIGSSQRGGASGGGWLKDFGIQPSDSAAHPAVSRNQIVSVTSYGPISETPQYLGGSILNKSFIDILSKACAHKVGNC